jgi:hypothetical protein
MYFFENILQRHIKDINKIVRDYKSIICWVYLMNNYKNRKIVIEKSQLCKTSILNRKEIDNIINYIFHSTYKIICINDYNIEKEEYDVVSKKLVQCLNMKFKNVCKYEKY